MRQLSQGFSCEPNKFKNKDDALHRIGQNRFAINK